LTEYVFDAGPLAAFARCRRLDLLERRYRGRAKWTTEVRHELTQGISRHPSLRDAVDADWLGEPARLTLPAELIEVERVRWALGGTSSNPRRHLGEAATIALALKFGYVAVIDERDARRLANALEVPVTGSVGILRAIVRDRHLDADEAWEIVQEMRSIGVRLPPDIKRTYFD
jgi:predicted nucleic acid-binding protein